MVEGEVITVYHTLENSRVYHEKDLDSVEFGLEVRLFTDLSRICWCSLFCVVACFFTTSLVVEVPGSGQT